MNKLKTLAIAIFLSTLTSVGYADWSAGVNLGGIAMKSVKGQETTNPSKSRSEDLEALYGSLFVEKNLGAVTLGLDVIPYNIETETVTNSRSGEAVDTGTTTVQADIEMHSTLYALINLGDTPAYVKVGASYANIATNETMGATNSKYPDADMWGGHVSLGAQFEVNEIFVRAEAGFSQYEDIDVSSSGGDGAANKVTVSGLDGPHARISIGKTF